MTSYLLDTNVLSEITRLRPEPRVLGWFTTQENQFLSISVITVGEIRRGARLLAEGKRRFQLELWIQQDMRALLAGGILAVTEDVADSWGSLSAARQREGRPLPIADGLIAATALVNNLTLVTRNTSDFESLGLVVLNPWHNPARPVAIE